MSLRVISSILRNQWLIEPKSGIQLLDFWLNNKEGGWSYKLAKGMSDDDGASRGIDMNEKFFAGSKVKYGPTRNWQINDFSFEGAKVAIIPVQGPMMKADNCGDLGTASLKLVTKMAEMADSVQSIIFLNDSPGGTVDGTKALADVIASCKKRTISLVDGMMCSANYWTGSSAKEVYALNATDIIGSIGTMCAWYDDSKAMEEQGFVLREYYATASKDKNRIFREADAGDGKLLIETLLDPMNDMFLGAVTSNRSGKIDVARNNVLTGHTYLAAEAKANGLIDDIVSFEDIVDDALRTGGTTTVFFNSNNNENKNTMATEIKTVDQLKAAYPDLTTEIHNSAVAQERDRVGAWIELHDADPAAVKTGINEGKVLGQREMAQLVLKMNGKRELKNREDDATGGVPAEEQGIGGQETALDALFAGVKRHIAKD